MSDIGSAHFYYMTLTFFFSIPKMCWWNLSGKKLFNQAAVGSAVGEGGKKKKSINLPPQMEITVLSSHHLTSLFSADELALRSRVKFQDGEKNK